MEFGASNARDDRPRRPWLLHTRDGTDNGPRLGQQDANDAAPLRQDRKELAHKAEGARKLIANSLSKPLLWCLRWLRLSR